MKRGPYKKTKPEQIAVHPMREFAEKLMRFLALHSHDDYRGVRGYRFTRIDGKLNGLRDA